MVFQSAHYKRQEDDDQESLERFESDPTVSFFLYFLLQYIYLGFN